MLPSSNIYCLYRHIRLDKNECFYVGIGKKSRAYSKFHRNKHWKNIVNTSQYIVEIVFDNLSKEEAIQKEIELIKYYGRVDLKSGSLVNLTDGGEGNFNALFSEERKRKISKANLGKKLSEQHKLSISKAHLGKKRSEQHKLNMSKGNLGKKRSEEAKEKYSKAKKGKKLMKHVIDSIKKRQSKPILQYDLNNNFIKKWESGVELAKSLHISRNYIRDYCLNIKNHNYYKFEYA